MVSPAGEAGLMVVATLRIDEEGFYVPRNYVKSSVITCIRCLEHKRHPRHTSYCAKCLAEVAADLRDESLPNERFLRRLEASGRRFDDPYPDTHPAGRSFNIWDDEKLRWRRQHRTNCRALRGGPCSCDAFSANP
jgi:hypothetical protein